MNEQLRIALENFLNALRDSDAVVRYENAKALYATDGKLMALIDQYNCQGKLLRDEGEKADRNDELLAQITNKLKELYDEIMENETMLAMQAAEQEISAIINDVNRGMQSILQPEMEGGCTGNCSTCSSCH
ncbi:MAG: YlbF family regulator [Clostridia bacterium]|nr:YlbF family regulator [Clostridia bacterium]